MKKPDFDTPQPVDDDTGGPRIEYDGDRLDLAPGWHLLNPGAVTEPLAGSTMRFPSTVRVVYVPGGGQPDLVMLIEMVDGAPQCRAVELRSRPDGRAVRTSDLTRIRVADIVSSAVAALAWAPDGPGRYAPIAVGDQRIEEARLHLEKSIRLRAQHGTPEQLAEVARVYKEAPSRPTQTVAEFFGVSDRTAGNWIKNARSTNGPDGKPLLPPTTKGRVAR